MSQCHIYYKILHYCNWNKRGVIYLLATKARSITNFFSLSSHQKLKIQLWASSKKWAFKTIHSLSWCQKFSSSSPWAAPQLRRTFAYYYIKATIAAKAILLLTTPLLPPIHSLQQAKSVCLKGFCISLLASESGYIWWCIHRFYKSWIKIQKKSSTKLNKSTELLLKGRLCESGLSSNK